jgi:hypothetical protein
MWDSLSDEATRSATLSFTVAPDQVGEHRIYVRAPANGPEAQSLTMKLEALDAEKSSDADKINFDRPEVTP